MTTKTIENKRLLVKRIITKNDFYTGEDCHERWSKLYDSYDKTYDETIRKARKEYNTTSYPKVSIINFATETGRIDKLLNVALKLYNKEATKLINKRF
jgi:hypothetical protein